MGLGVIAILDALGFKGIWSRESAKAVMARLKALRRRALSLQGTDRNGALLSDSGLRHRVRFLSDTIVVTVMVKGPKAPARGLYRAMHSAAMIAGTIMYEAISDSPALLLRGCIAAGKMTEDSDFLIGPAVDEAAERFEAADGPFLWLAPSALAITRKYSVTYSDRLVPWILVPYTLPLNDGTFRRTHVFNYFGVNSRELERERVAQLVLNGFGRSRITVSVKRKKDNAAKFLAHVARIDRRGKWRIQEATTLPEWNELSPSQQLRLLLRGICWAPAADGWGFHGNS